MSLEVYRVINRRGRKNRRARADVVQSATDVVGEFREAGTDAARHSDRLFFFLFFLLLTGNFEYLYCVYRNILN